MDVPYQFRTFRPICQTRASGLLIVTHKKGADSHKRIGPFRGLGEGSDQKLIVVPIAIWRPSAS